MGWVAIVAIACQPAAPPPTVNATPAPDAATAAVATPAPTATTAATSAPAPQPTAVPSPAPVTAASIEQPTYTGAIGPLEQGIDFETFLFDHDGQVVYLDTYFPVTPDPNAVDVGENWFVLWTDCPELPVDALPGMQYCTGTAVNVYVDGSPEHVWGYNQGFQYLKGYWSVTALPGMHQGQLSVNLTAARP